MTITVGGVIATENKDAMFIAGRVMAGIDLLVAKSRNDSVVEGNSTKDFQRCIANIEPKSSMLLINFCINKESRTLSVFLDCDSDNADIARNSISIRMGASGNAEQYIKMALLSLSMLGDTYYQTDFDEKIEKMDGKISNYLDACALGMERPNLVSLGQWMKIEGGKFAVLEKDGIFLDKKDIENIGKMNYDQSKQVLEPMVAEASMKLSASTTSDFMNIMSGLALFEEGKNILEKYSKVTENSGDLAPAF